jgi:hypothetical protein
MDKEQRAEIIQQRTRDTMKLDPKVDLQLGDSTRVLLFNNRAIKGILEDTGINLLRDGLTIDHLSDPNILTKILKRGLQAHWPEVSEEGLDDLVSMRHFLYYQTQIFTALSLFYPDIKDLPKLPDAEPEPAGDPT